MSGGCVLNSDNERMSSRINADWAVDAPEDDDAVWNRDYIEDEEWGDLICQARIWSVEHFDGVVRFSFGSSIDQNEKTVFAEYVHNADLQNTRLPCVPEHKNIPCGLCSVPLDDEWYIEFWWSPEDIGDDELERVVAGEISDEEYRESINRDLAQCRIDGYAEIGYDMDKFQ